MLYGGIEDLMNLIHTIFIFKLFSKKKKIVYSKVKKTKNFGNPFYKPFSLMKKNLSFTLISFFFWVQFLNVPFNYMFKKKVELIGKKIG